MAHKNGSSELGKSKRQVSYYGSEEWSGNKNCISATLNLRQSLAVQWECQANIRIHEFRSWGKSSGLVLDIWKSPTYRDYMHSSREWHTERKGSYGLSHGNKTGHR